MIRFALMRALACPRKRMAEGRPALALVRKVWRDKSACHELRKPLMRLGFSCACRSVACIGHGFGEGFQESGVAEAPSSIGGAVQ